MAVTDVLKAGSAERRHYEGLTSAGERSIVRRRRPPARGDCARAVLDFARRQRSRPEPDQALEAAGLSQ